MDVIKFFKDEWATIVSARWTIATAVILAAVAGFWVSDYHYSGRIEGLKETLETKEFPKPIIRTVIVPVTDKTQATLATSLQAQLDEAHRTIGILAQRPASAASPTRSSRPIAATAPTSGGTSMSNQSGGVAMGSSGSIGTVNQNGLPARSVFAAPLGNFYTEGYLILQRASILGLKDTEITDLDRQFGVWRQKIITWMNANMCTDAAAYFLKAHRASLSFSGVPETQNRLLDTLSWSLDNLSDIKRNDAWDCK
jgi:hypothetical protein